MVSVQEFFYHHRGLFTRIRERRYLANDIKFSAYMPYYEHRTPKKDWYDATIVIQDMNPGVHFISRDEPPIHPKQSDI